MNIPEAMNQNSAGRLLAILSLFRNGHAVSDQLIPVFGGESDSVFKKNQSALKALFLLHTLYQEFLEDMRNAEISVQQREVLLRGLINLPQSIYPDGVNTGFRAVPDAEMALLEVCATVIHQEAPLQKSDIDKIRESVASLRNFIDDAEISSSLRTVLLDLIRITEDAISRYNIYGARGLRNAYKSMLSEAIVVYSASKSSGTSEAPKEKTVWVSINNHLDTINRIATTLMKYKPLLEWSAALLFNLPPPQPTIEHGKND